jgi:Na+-transporting methylmalonyl-CoA/oxaloacetate decarboxylase gamma subunit
LLVVAVVSHPSIEMMMMVLLVLIMMMTMMMMICVLIRAEFKKKKKDDDVFAERKQSKLANPRRQNVVTSVCFVSRVKVRKKAENPFVVVPSGERKTSKNGVLLVH